MNILELQDLKKYFATQKAVDGISFNIEKGSIFGLLGPNGAGKTTLIRMITGIFYQDSGQILFNGHPFKPERDITSIGYMPEERGLYKKMKIGEQAMYLAQLKGLSRTAATEAVKEWFVKFEMESWWNKKVEDLSKGMSQKLQFVTTVLHRPELIILDEPFSGLDPVNASLIKDEIFNLAKSGSTIIFSTHRMEQVEEICDQIVLINRGKKILDGKVERIKQDFKENLFSIQTDEGDVTEDPSLFRIIEKRKDRIRIRLEEGVSTNKVLGYLIDKNVTIRNFNEVLPSLDEIFIKLVEHSGATRSFQKIND
jgi:ABC-2 type transport system ATP-binding protein